MDYVILVLRNTSEWKPAYDNVGSCAHRYVTPFQRLENIPEK